MHQIVGQLNPLYEQLPQEVRNQFNELSQLIRTLNLSDNDINKRLDKLRLDSNNNTAEDDDQPMVSAGTPSVKLEVGFDYSSPGAKRLKDNNFDDCEEEEVEDTFKPVVNAVHELGFKFPKASIVCICFNVLVHTFEDEFIPIEIGLTELSLEEGVKKSYTKLIQNEVPSGYYSKAKEFSEAYHKIPLNTRENPDFDGNHKQLFDEIYDFMANSDLRDSATNRIIIFGRPEDRNGLSDRRQIIGCLKWFQKMKGSAAKSLVDDFLVADLSDLLFVTTRAFCMSARMKALCIDDLNSARIDFFSDLRCGFHSEDENNYCALLATKRLAFLFIDSVFGLGLRPELDIKPKESHRPVAIKIESTTTECRFNTLPQLRDRPQYRYHLDEPNRELSPNEEFTRKLGIGRGQRPNNLNNRSANNPN